MSIGIGDSMLQYASSITTSNTGSKIENMSDAALAKAEDKELMDACREFEAYFLEQLMKQMEKTVIKSDLTEESETESYFKEMLYQEYAARATEGEGVGIAKMMYEQMKQTGSKVL